MTTLVDVGCAEELEPGGAIAVSVGAFAVAVFNVGGELFAIDDVCVHCGASLASGEATDHNVSCAQCGWRYDLATGCVCALPPLRVDRYSVSLVDRRIVVDARALP